MATVRLRVVCVAAIVVCASISGARTEGSGLRVVSLAPSLTEIAYALGCGPKLVADTTFDDYPPAATRLTHVADLVTVDLERLSTLAPTIVLALHDQEREAAPIASQLHIPVEYLPNRDLDNLFEDIDGVGKACGDEAGAQRLAATLHRRFGQLAHEVSRYRARPRVFFLVDLPGFTVGAHSFLDDLIRLAGAVNVAGSIGQPYPNVSGEWLLKADPDVIIVARETKFGPSVMAQEPWRSLRALKTGSIVRPPSDDIIERNGPRVVDGLAWLISAIHARRE